MNRDDFRTQVLARDHNLCVICKEPATAAHHIIERRLWPNGGYQRENGASLCDVHHIQAEQTFLTCDQIRNAADIKQVILPPHLNPDEQYDKWGNILLTGGRRLKGELFYEESVQKALIDVLPQFCDFVKYPRTLQLPWSPGRSSDDIFLDTTEHFTGKEVVVTTKMDGENVSMYWNYIHARSIDFKNHPSRDWIQSFHASIAYNIPQGFRICGENLYARHSIAYNNLESYFLLFSIWEENRCLSWAETLEYAALLGLHTVPVIYSGVWNEELIENLYQPVRDGDPCEGYVVRVAGSFRYDEFNKSAAKYVRKGHITTDDHWMHGTITPNKLKERS